MDIIFQVNFDALQRHWPHSSVFNVNFEQTSHIVKVFPLLTINNWMLTRAMFSPQKIIYSFTTVQKNTDFILILLWS